MCNCVSYNLPHKSQRDAGVLLEMPFAYEGGKKSVVIDLCIVSQIKALWEAGIETKSSCCGHNNHAPRHVVVDQSHAVQAKKIMMEFEEPVSVVYWALVSA